MDVGLWEWGESGQRAAVVVCGLGRTAACGGGGATGGHGRCARVGARVCVYVWRVRVCVSLFWGGLATCAAALEWVGMCLVVGGCGIPRQDFPMQRVFGRWAAWLLDTI